MGKQFLVTVVIFAFAYSIVNAFNPSSLQDFCVAIDDLKDAVFVNGKVCKNPDLVSSDDFFFTGLNESGNIFNPLGSEVTTVDAIKLKGLNTLGVSLARLDFAPYGLNPPHIHPRATEVLYVLEGALLVGFVTSNIPNQKNRLFAKTLYPGDVFVFPEGLIHFQQNIAETNTIAFAALSSENPGVITVANAVFGSDPKISFDVINKAFLVDKYVTDYLHSQYWWDNHY